MREKIVEELTNALPPEVEGGRLLRELRRWPPLDDDVLRERLYGPGDGEVSEARFREDLVLLHAEYSNCLTVRIEWERCRPFYNRIQRSVGVGVMSAAVEAAVGLEDSEKRLCLSVVREAGDRTAFDEVPTKLGITPNVAAGLLRSMRRALQHRADCDAS